MANLTASISRRRALACCGATLLAYVGVVHEVIGSTVYPDGPASFGGPLGWHAAGFLLIALGVVIGAGTLGIVRVPIGSLAALASAAGVLGVIVEAFQSGGFHFFAFTMAVAGMVVVVAIRADDSLSAQGL